MPKIDKITYAKLFNIGLYMNERIGVEMQLDAGDDAKEALETARKLVHEYHREANKELYEREESIQEEPTKVLQQETPKEKAKTSMIDGINSCKDIKVLETYKFLCRSNPEFQKAYDFKLKQLQQ